MCCCHPAGSPPPLWDSLPPSHHLTGPEQHSHVLLQDCALFDAKPLRCIFAWKQPSGFWGHSEDSYWIGWLHLLDSYTSLHLCGECLFVLTFESSCCVPSSSSPFLVLLLSVDCRSSSLLTERGSRSDAIVPAVSLTSGGEELRDVCRRNSSMASL